ncbi:MAG: DUF5665 domain-containing protein [Desulfitobacteriaceae bacterium]|nr:DUF5665 domain-containing protein [Desulfitobacteriaceae bacterium]
MQNGGYQVINSKDTFEKKVDDLAIYLEKMKLAQYVELLNNPPRLIYLNLISGIARGFGVAIGFTILGALVVYFLRWLMVLNLPLVGDFIAELVQYVQESKGLRP